MTISIAQRLTQALPIGDGVTLPDRTAVAKLCHLVLDVLFPGSFSAAPSHDPMAAREALQVPLQLLLTDLISRAQRASGSAAGPSADALDAVAELPLVAALLATDVDAAFCNDPSAPDRATIVLSYPCIEALAIQRFAHRLYRRSIPLLPRMMTEWVHARTGIDIHPGASIDESFFIDHGTGVVIGETSRIGKHCVLYQSVGLVAWNPLARDEHGELRRGQSNKRHPDLSDHVTIYAGATILGGDTVIGHHSVIGGSVWLTHSVDPYSVVTIKDPELNIRPRRRT